MIADAFPKSKPLELQKTTPKDTNKLYTKSNNATDPAAAKQAIQSASHTALHNNQTGQLPRQRQRGPESADPPLSRPRAELGMAVTACQPLHVNRGSPRDGNRCRHKIPVPLIPTTNQNLVHTLCALVSPPNLCTLCALAPPPDPCLLDLYIDLPLQSPH